jgi:hypothetical protein
MASFTAVKASIFALAVVFFILGKFLELGRFRWEVCKGNSRVVLVI